PPIERRTHAQAIDHRPDRQGQDQEEPLLRVARQERQGQDRRQEPEAERPTRAMVVKSPECPGETAGRPEVRGMALERKGQKERGAVVGSRADRRRPSTLTHRAEEYRHAEPTPNQVADRQPAECGGGLQPPGEPDGWIEHPALWVADQRTTTESARVPERPV